MAESSSRQDKANTTVSLATQEGTMGPSCQLRIFRFSPVRKHFLFEPVANLSLTKLVRSLKMAEHG